MDVDRPKARAGLGRWSRLGVLAGVGGVMIGWADALLARAALQLAGLLDQAPVALIHRERS